MGDKCFFSHEDYDPVAIAAARASASFRSRGGFRGGMRGGVPRDRMLIPPSSFSRPSRDFPRSVDDPETRGFFAPTKGESKIITLKGKSQYDDLEIEDLDQQVRRIYADLIRLEPVRRRMNSGKSLDMMFIIDCTGSMGSWIEACKKEIRSIIDCVRNQHFNIKIRVSIVAYRDHCDGKDIEEICPFTDDIETCSIFLKKLVAKGGGDMPEDVAGGLENAIK